MWCQCSALFRQFGILHGRLDPGVIVDNVFGKYLPATSIACSIEDGKVLLTVFVLKRPPPDNVGIFKSVVFIIPDLRAYSTVRSLPYFFVAHL